MNTIPDTQSEMSTVSSLGAAPAMAHIRWLIRRDMPEVLAIEHDSFDNPWNEEEFLRSLRQRNCIGMVAELEERVVGFMIYELHKTKLNILSLVVHSEFRRRGLGTQMINKLKSKLSSHHRTRLTTDAKRDDSQARDFLLSCGLAMADTPVSPLTPELVEAYRAARRLLKQAKKKLKEERQKLKTALGVSEFSLVKAALQPKNPETQYYDLAIAEEVVAIEPAPQLHQETPLEDLSRAY